MRKVFRYRIIIAVLLLVFSSTFVVAEAIAEKQSRKLVTVYSYHLKPPYIIDLVSETGLYFDFVDYLNQNLTEFQFHLTYLPRKRLDIYLQRDGLNGVVVGVNPAWFKDRAEEKYYWSSKIFDDRDDVVSSIDSPIDYKGPESLWGKSIGGVLGYYYFGINEAVALGKIRRENANSERSLLEMIHHKRVSAGVVSNATYNYLIVKHGWQGRFHLSEQPHDEYTRHVMIPLYLEDIKKAIFAITQDLNSNPDWQQILSKYQIKY